MTDQLLQTLESKLEQLLTLCDQLQQENQAYKQREAEAAEREQEWQQERDRLIEKNELARTRVEAMIARLKSLESDA